jgi:hypothetical protein
MTALTIEEQVILLNEHLKRPTLVTKKNSLMVYELKKLA